MKVKGEIEFQKKSSHLFTNCPPTDEHTGEQYASLHRYIYLSPETNQIGVLIQHTAPYILFPFHGGTT